VTAAPSESKKARAGAGLFCSAGEMKLFRDCGVVRFESVQETIMRLFAMVLSCVLLTAASASHAGPVVPVQTAAAVHERAAVVHHKPWHVKKRADRGRHLGWTRGKHKGWSKR
jgi:hypothetical protein